MLFLHSLPGRFLDLGNIMTHICLTRFKPSQFAELLKHNPPRISSHYPNSSPAANLHPNCHTRKTIGNAPRIWRLTNPRAPTPTIQTTSAQPSTRKNLS